jgi:hypothetical protein
VPPLERERERLTDAVAEMQARDAARAAAASRRLDELIGLRGLPSRRATLPIGET